ncbi:hypothetical protein IFM89_028350 [Coptis chinensis]|uniref:Elongin-A n=1 Tax=Coptis chinensis TaxID=261450 RepID=A0A835IZ02_9MAGN|nr:hypothetical protein IFM89_028350 [Coptis chinensis]
MGSTKDPMYKKKPPSLVQLCVQTAIDNVRYLGNIGDTDIDLLEDILSHCTLDQLKCIEDSTQGRDLSPVTDKLWKKFYKKEFGVDCLNTLVEKMNKRKVSFKWRELFEAKTKAVEEASMEIRERFRQRYEEEQARKQSRQTRICTKLPPSSSKRNFWGSSGPGTNFSNAKGSLMKKARMEYLNSHEAKVHATIRKNAVQRSQSQSIRRPTKPAGLLGKHTASSSKFTSFRRS